MVPFVELEINEFFFHQVEMNVFFSPSSGSLAGQTLIIGAKESGETHAKVVSHNGMLSCQSDSL